MRTITLVWDLPTVRADGSVLPANEIDFTEVLLSADAGKTFASLAKVKGTETQTINKDVADGTYTARFIVTNIYGKAGAAVDAIATVTTAVPGKVTNIKVTIA